MFGELIGWCLVMMGSCLRVLWILRLCWSWIGILLLLEELFLVIFGLEWFIILGCRWFFSFIIFLDDIYLFMGFFDFGYIVNCMLVKVVVVGG